MELFEGCLFAFLGGGVLSGIAQLFIDLTSLTPPRILVAYVCFGVFLGAVGLFSPLYDLVGCGITVPLVGFGGKIAEGIREAVETQGLLGVLTGSLQAAAAGTSAALIFGYLFGIFFNGKPARA